MGAMLKNILSFSQKIKAKTSKTLFDFVLSFDFFVGVIAIFVILVMLLVMLLEKSK